ncbi:MAG TPA: hypothetical protein VHD15_14360 [Hyphomicrobiales bacterium]|nr:hypothetical protein [Hyphomicrobiales bacterium]
MPGSSRLYVSIYPIRVTGGNAPLLQACATEPGIDDEVAGADELVPIVQSIANRITSRCPTS